MWQEDGLSIQMIAVCLVSLGSTFRTDQHTAKLPYVSLYNFFSLLISLYQNFPGRSAPIKEQTVTDYLLEAAREGLPFDWNRFCEVIGLTAEIISDIQGAILKVGSTEKLKPIKNELPEDVSSISDFHDKRLL